MVLMSPILLIRAVDLLESPHPVLEAPEMFIRVCLISKKEGNFIWDSSTLQQEESIKGKNQLLVDTNTCSANDESKECLFSHFLVSI